MEIESFRDFRALAVEVWQEGVFGVPVADSLVAFTLFWAMYRLPPWDICC